MILMVGVAATYGGKLLRRCYAALALPWLSSPLFSSDDIQLVVLGAAVVTVLVGLAYLTGRTIRKLQLDRDKTRGELRRVDESLNAERALLARELHDSAVTDLSLISTSAENLKLLYPDEDLVARLESIRSRAGGTIDQLGRIITLLRGGEPLESSEHKMLPTVSEGLERFRMELCSAGVPTSVEATNGEDILGSTAQVALYRMLQEAVTNVIKYGARSQEEPTCHIRFAVEQDRAELCVRNRIDPERQRKSPSAGVGLEILKERAAAYGAAVQAGSDNDGNWHLRVTNMRIS